MSSTVTPQMAKKNKGGKAMESRCPVKDTEASLKDISGNLPKDSAKQREGKPVICPPLPQCDPYSFLEQQEEEMKAEFLSLWVRQVT